MKPSLRHLVPLLLALAAPQVRADTRLLPDRLSVEPVSTIQIQVMVANDGASSLSQSFPDTVRGVLHGGSDHSESVVLERTSSASSVEVLPGAFSRASYSLKLPTGYLGPVVLELPSLAYQPVMFSIQAGRPAALASSPSAEAAGRDSSTSGTALSAPASAEAEADRAAAMRRATRVLAGVSAYDPVYFALGAGGGLNAKFQFSLKYNPLDMQPFYLGFTQTSIWDLHGESKPFHDSAYRPSLFYAKDKLLSFDNLGGDPKRSLVFGLQGGFEHESNGRGGDDSRSINIAFVRPRMTWNFREGMRLVLAPKVYGYLEKSENPDIAEYRGYVDLYAALHVYDWKLSTVLRKGTRDNRGSVQVDAVIPLKITDDLFAKVGVHGVNGYWLIQYFSGWGETIIDYRTKGPSQVRLGLLVVP